MADSLPTSQPPAIAWFDLDGTLLAWDCQLLFRHFVLRREPWRGIFLPVFLLFLPLTGLLGAGGMKRIFLSFLWRMPQETLDAYAKEFAHSVLPTIFPQLRERLETHRHAGHFLILASASPEFYVQHIGRELGFHLTLGTVVELGPFFPDLENHKGQAKVAKLHQLLPPEFFEHGKLRGSHGYSDSRADLPMLALCHRVTVVNPSAALETLAIERSWEILRPPRPWKSRPAHALQVLRLLTGIGR